MRALFANPAAIFVYLIGALFIIYLAALPGDFSKPNGVFNALLFAWTAAMSTRGNRFAIFWVFIVALYYAVAIDDGIALGAFALITMAAILSKFHNPLVNAGILTRTAVVTALYAAIMLIRNLIMAMFLLPGLRVADLIGLVLSFLLAYIISNIVFLFASSMRRRFEHG